MRSIAGLLDILGPESWTEEVRQLGPNWNPIGNYIGRNEPKKRPVSELAQMVPSSLVSRRMGAELSRTAALPGNLLGTWHSYPSGTFESRVFARL